MKKIYVIKAIVFLAAFLMFQIELIIAKILLPNFGGGYAVWGAAMVFFQAMLLFGYLYSHLVIKKLGMLRYLPFHLGLMALTLAFFPGRALPVMTPATHLPMVFSISWQLLWGIGACFFFLSTTSVIFQSWLASSELEDRENPYPLYGVSNLGSFAALLTYPWFFEAVFDLNVQLTIWRLAYLALVILHLAAFVIIKVSRPVAQDTKGQPPVSRKDRLRWVLLGAAGVIMFLSITNSITYAVMPMPLLWILPLSIYLASFALNFKKNPWCPAWVRGKFHIVLAVSVILYFFTEGRILDFAIMLIAYLAVLFAVCMVCQSELYKSRPSDDRNLTSFYLAISLGGFLGGIVVSWIMPLVSSATVEYLIGLLAVCSALAIGQKRPLFQKTDILVVAGLAALLAVWPMAFSGYNVFGVVIIVWAFCAAYARLNARPLMLGVSVLLALGMAASPLTGLLWSKQRVLYRHRNYYGIYKVHDAQEKRYLTNGTTLHGAQYLIKERENEPLIYYNSATPLGRLLISPVFTGEPLGVVGLGAGAVAAYGRKGQTIDFFELDPEVYRIADKYFTYLKNCAASVNFIFGDARISVGGKPEHYYGMLIIDAFSGDYIPAHLLTTEAILEYRMHLVNKGILLFHVTNRYLFLSKVLFAGANSLGAYACMAGNQASLDAFSSEWVALTWDKNIFNALTSTLEWRPAPEELPKNIKPWTDQYTNVLSILKAESLINQIKAFQPFYWDFSGSREKVVNLRYYAAQGARSLIARDFNQAISYYQKALELSPRDAAILKNLGDGYYLSGQYRQAAEAYQKTLEINPHNADALRNLGKAYARQKNYTRALEYYGKALSIAPGDPAVRLGVADVYLGLKQVDKAAENVLKARGMFEDKNDLRNVKRMDNLLDRLRALPAR